ncbi:MAG TPA: hypothetical protein VMV15_10455 [Candidatus Binataceae bacterium]|nr:hypothetical protein [Candidatus Binataceae bacterium]
MNYLIRNGQSYAVSGPSASYRGTNRSEPIYCEEFTEDHEINQLYTWYLEETGRSGFIHDLTKALRYVKLCNLHFPSKQFELIQVTDGHSTTNHGAGFLGFDISLGGNGDSLIFLALLSGPLKDIPQAPIAVLSNLVRCHFTPKLNEFGLFQMFEDASHCRKAMIALQSFHPNLYEGGNLEDFTVSGVYLLPQSEDGAT